MSDQPPSTPGRAGRGRRFVAAVALLTGGLSPLHAAEWQALSAAERQALAPLAAAWPGMSESQRDRWQDVARRWSALPAAEQWRLQARMREWASLSTEQRSAARLQFQEALRVPEGDRQRAWQAYQSLTEAERRALAERARNPTSAPGLAGGAADGGTAKDNLVLPSPSRAQPVSQAARQTQHGASTTPLTRPALPPPPIQHGMPKLSTQPGFVDRATLLPQRGPQGAAARPARPASAASAP